MAPLRVIDTGLMGPAENVAWDNALLSLRAQGKIPDTIRFCRSTPAVLVGMQHHPADEVDAEFCRAQNIELLNRLTPGSPVYMDEGMLGWEVVFHESSLPTAGSMDELAKTISKAVAGALKRFGLDATFRLKNDIEVDGKKICASSGIASNGAILYQGLISVDPDLDRCAMALLPAGHDFSQDEICRAKNRIGSIRLQLPSDIHGAQTKQGVSTASIKRHVSDAIGAVFTRQTVVTKPHEEAGMLAKNLSPDAKASPEPAEKRVYKILRTESTAGNLSAGVAAKFDILGGLMRDMLVDCRKFSGSEKALFNFESAMRNTRVEILEKAATKTLAAIPALDSTQKSLLMKMAGNLAGEFGRVS